MPDVVVIGGGASGLTAAGFAAMYGADVKLFEKMPRVGRKLMITGKGRCNLANACDINEFMRNVPVNNKFLYSALNNFPPFEIIDFFESRGLKTKIERGNRVFPVSDKAVDVVDTMRNFAVENGAKIIRCEVEDILVENGSVKAVKAGGKIYACNSVIIATGGMSYPKTGSTGDGYKFAEKTGHTVVDPKPSLISLESPDSDCKALQGLSLKNVKLNIFTKSGGKVYSDFGEMIFTHNGISGPIVLSASCNMRDYSSGYSAHIDFKPALSYEQLDLRVQRDFKDNINKAASNSLNKLLPKKLIPVVLKRWEISADKKCNSITKEERKALVGILKDFVIKISAPGPLSEAIITSGGVKVSEINPKTMESKIIKNLFFAGEVIDVDAYTGGFNLVIAWTTGRLAGESAGNTAY